MKIKNFCVLLCVLLCSSCAHHPLDCAIDFVPHDDCLPGTAGYESMQKRAALAGTMMQIQQQDDDVACKSYGVNFGTSEYAQCRETLLGLRSNQAIANQNNQIALRQQAIGIMQANRPKTEVYQSPTTVNTDCTTYGHSINCQTR